MKDEFDGGAGGDVISNLHIEVNKIYNVKNKNTQALRSLIFSQSRDPLGEQPFAPLQPERGRNAGGGGGATASPFDQQQVQTESSQQRYGTCGKTTARSLSTNSSSTFEVCEAVSLE